MLVELSIMPLGPGPGWIDHRSEILKVVDTSGLAYQLTPSGFCIEGHWDEVMTLIRRCHDRVRRSCAHVITTIRIEDQEGVNDQLTRNVAEVEEKAAQPLRA